MKKPYAAFHLAVIASLLVAGVSVAQRVRHVAPPADIGIKSEKAIIAMEFSAKRATVQVYIDGKGPYPFVFDTGAPGSVIDAGLAKELELAVIGRAQIGDPSGRNPLSADRVQVGILTAGDVEIADLTLTAVPLEERFESGFLGVLGYKHFADYLITMDYPGRTITVEEGELDPDVPDVTGYRSPYGLIALDIKVNRETVSVHLDSGSSGGFTLAKKTADGLPWLEAPKEERTAKTVNNEYTVYKGRLDGTVKFAGLSYDDPEIEFVEGIRASTIGQKILQDLIVTIDQQNQRILLTEPESR
jgi:hypothetical protein